MKNLKNLIKRAFDSEHWLTLLILFYVIFACKNLENFKAFTILSITRVHLTSRYRFGFHQVHFITQDNYGIKLNSLSVIVVVMMIVVAAVTRIDQLGRQLGARPAQFCGYVSHLFKS